MSWTDEEIDNVFGEAADKQSFEYRPEYWKDIEKQLPVSKNRKPLFWWVTASVFFIGLLSLFFVGGNNSNSIINNSVNQIASNVTPDNEEFVNSKLGDVKENQESFTSEKNNSKKTETLKEQVQTTRNNEKQSFEKKNTPNFANTPHATDNNETVDFSKDMNTIGFKENETPIEESDEVVTKDEKMNEEIETTEIGTLPFQSLIFETKSAELVSGQLKAKNNSDLKMFVELNGSIGQAWTSNEENQNLANGSLGVATGVLIPANKFIFSAGLGFQATKLDDLRIKERTIVYGFGSNILENTYQFNSIYEINLPLSLGYSAGRHSVEFGVNTSMKLFTSVLRTQSLDGNQTIYSKGIANVSLFNRFGIQPSLGYGFFVNEKVQIGVRGSVQLIQPIQSDRFTGTKIKMPIEGQVYLKRTINF